MNAVASNDYEIRFAARDAIDNGALIAYAANGAPLPPDNKGPLWIVYPYDSAVMLQSRLREGMKLMDVLPMTKSLGAKVEGQAETWAWTDAGGIHVELQFRKGVLQRWELRRPAEAADDVPGTGAA